MITNKMKIVQLKMREARFWPKMKFEPIFFSGSLAVFQSERVASAGGRKGGLGGIPPALQILGEICSNFFVKRPQIVNRQRCARPAKRGRGERIKASQRDKFEAAAES